MRDPMMRGHRWRWRRQSGAVFLALGLGLSLLAACGRGGDDGARRPAAAAAADPQTQAAVKAALDRLDILVQQRDPTVLEEFSTASDVTVVGSGSDEVARGRAQVVALFHRLFTLPVTVEWQWRQVDVSALGDVAWVFASGDLVMHAADGDQRSPYRLTGVLVREGGHWRWRQFHGSQPDMPADAPTPRGQ